MRNQEGDNLEKRIQARKRAGSLKPANFKDLEKPKLSKIEIYQNEIEQIMEKYAEEKIMKTSAIKKKYNELKIPQEHPEMCEKLKEEQENMMKKEINDLLLEIQKERKEKIMMLRTRFEG